jgi:predicted component of type VI protein secretion system
MFRRSTEPGDKPPAGTEGLSRASAALELEHGNRLEIRDIATIGRAPDSTLVLESRSISRHHARIFYEGGHYWLKDLDSANGTTLNGKKIKLQMLADKDRISFGDVKAVFHFAGALGPAAIAKDPLEGSDPAFEDGTPTGGMRDRHLAAEPSRIRQLEKQAEDARARAETMEKENDRLKKLVKQLERALADSNLRVRNLQERLDRS